MPDNINWPCVQIHLVDALHEAIVIHPGDTPLDELVRANRTEKVRQECLYVLKLLEGTKDGNR